MSGLAMSTRNDRVGSGRRRIVIIKGFLIFGALFAWAEEPKLEMVLSSEKSSHLVSEHIWLTLSITNTGTDSVHTRRPYFVHGALELLVRDSFDRIFPIDKANSDHYPKSFVFPPGYTHILNHSVVPSHGEGANRLLRNYLTESFLPPGFYNARVEFYAGHDTIESNVVTFQVTAPDSDQSVALGLLATLEMKDMPDSSSYQLIRKLVSDYPNSPYTRMAFYQRAVRTHWSQESVQQKTELAKELIDRYPDSYESQGVITSILVHAVKDRSERSAFLMDVITAHPDTRSARRCREILDND